MKTVVEIKYLKTIWKISETGKILKKKIIIKSLMIMKTVVEIKYLKIIWKNSETGNFLKKKDIIKSV